MKQTSKDKVLAVLEAHRGEFISGGMLANELSISRNSVWKAVRSLESEGHSIDSVTGKGYCLLCESHVLSAAAISALIERDDIAVEYHDSIDSTNTRAKELGEIGAPHATLVVAGQQTAGRGRQGRAFCSPADTGVYFSLLLRPNLPLSDVSLLTSYAAVCVADALDELFDVDAQIKWVNDVFVQDKKVCGILTEASFNAESASVAYAVVGIGINIFAPKDETGELSSIVGGAIREDTGIDMRAPLIASVVNRFLRDYDHVAERPHLESYRKRSLLDGRRVEVQQGAKRHDALVLGINEDFTLSVMLDDGTTHNLAYGEVHIPSSQLL